MMPWWYDRVIMDPWIRRWAKMAAQCKHRINAIVTIRRKRLDGHGYDRETRALDVCNKRDSAPGDCSPQICPLEDTI